MTRVSGKLVHDLIILLTMVNHDDARKNDLHFLEILPSAYCTDASTKKYYLNGFSILIYRDSTIYCNIIHIAGTIPSSI
jgi:hypothetical protein